MKKWRQIAFSQNSLRKFLGFGLFFRAAKFNHHLEIVDSLEYHRILVLAPHPDDDIFGLGGTMAKLSNAGADITVAYFCDGSGGTAKVGEQKDINLIELRKKEAQRAGEILKIKSQVFFGYPDGQLKSDGISLRALNDLIESFKPDIIFVPSFLDNHPDHRAVNEILAHSVAKDSPELPVWLYEIWTPIFANRIVNINDEIETKKVAMATQVSQLKARNYDQAVLGLNQYRAEINGQKGYAEGFFATTMEVYRKMHQDI